METLAMVAMADAEREQRRAAQEPPPSSSGVGGSSGGASRSIPPLWSIPGMPRVTPGVAMQQQQATSERREEQGCYPPPLVPHEEVIADEQLFLKTLENFHNIFGTQLSFPRVPLDIHRLYVEVIKYGGLQKVVNDDLWDEVASSFDLPPIVTSPSYFLRNHYVKTLFHYEQVYHRKVQGTPVVPPGPLPGPRNITKRSDSKSKAVCPPVTRKRGREKFDQVSKTRADRAVPVGHVVTGAIDGKFEHGYFVTVVVGSERLRGVIYNVPPNQAESPQFSEVTELVKRVGLPLDSSPDVRHSNRKQKQPADPDVRYNVRKPRKRDPEAPRPARTAYSFFVSEKRRHKQEAGRGAWNNLSLQDKLPFLQKAEQDKARYQRELRQRNEPQVQQQLHDEAAAVYDDYQVDAGYTQTQPGYAQPQPGFTQPQPVFGPSDPLPLDPLTYNVSYDLRQQSECDQADAFEISQKGFELHQHKVCETPNPFEVQPKVCDRQNPFEVHEHPFDLHLQEPQLHIHQNHQKPQVQLHQDHGNHGNHLQSGSQYPQELLEGRNQYPQELMEGRNQYPQELLEV